MSSTVIRIKRPLTQEPAEALVLASKRARIEKSDGDDVAGGNLAAALGDETQKPTNVFKFCGTLNDEKDNMSGILKFVKTSQASSFRQSPKAIKRIQPAKVDKRASIPTSDKKYKVLSSLRNIDEAHDVKMYDLVAEDEENLSNKPEVVTINGVPMQVEHVKPYVYDYYYCEGQTIDDTYIDQLMNVQRYFYESEGSDSEHDDNDSNSNDENHWKNDYPEEDDNDGEDDDDLVDKMVRMGLNGNSSGNGYLSSSDDDFPVYAKDDDDPLPGDAYAKYKKRVNKHLKSSFDGDYDDDDDEEEDESDDDVPDSPLRELDDDVIVLGPVDD